MNEMTPYEYWEQSKNKPPQVFLQDFLKWYETYAGLPDLLDVECKANWGTDGTVGSLTTLVHVFKKAFEECRAITYASYFMPGPPSARGYIHLVTAEDFITLNETFTTA